MVLTNKQRVCALAAGLTLVLSACASSEDSETNPADATDTETSAQTSKSTPSEKAAPKGVVQGFVTADAQLNAPAGARLLSGETAERWASHDQLSLMVFDDHYSGSENYPTVELRYSPQHFSAEAAVDYLSLVFPHGDMGEPVTIAEQEFNQYVGSGELLVGSDYVETPGEVYYAVRNEGTYFLYVVGIPGEESISDDLRQTAFDALYFDTTTVDQYFPPSQEDGAVTFDLDSFSTFEVGVDIEPGRYEVHGHVPEGIFPAEIVAQNGSGSVYDAYRTLRFFEDSEWMGLMELYEGDVVTYTQGGVEPEPNTYGSVTFKPIPEPSVFRTLLPGHGTWVSGVDFEPGTYQLRSILNGQVGIFDPEGDVIFDGSIASVTIEDAIDLKDRDSDEYIEREGILPTGDGMVAISTAFDLPAGSRIVTWPDSRGETNALELVPAPRETEVAEPEFTSAPGKVNANSDDEVIFAGEELDPGLYTVTLSSNSGSSYGKITVKSLSGHHIYAQQLEPGVTSEPFYLPANSVLRSYSLYEDPNSLVFEPSEPVVFEGGLLEDRMLMVGTDIEAGTWTLSGWSGVLDVLDSNANLVNRIPVWAGAEYSLELEQGQVLVQSIHSVLGALALERS